MVLGSSDLPTCGTAAVAVTIWPGRDDAGGSSRAKLCGFVDLRRTHTAELSPAFDPARNNFVVVAHTSLGPALTGVWARQPRCLTKCVNLVLRPPA